MQYKAVNYCRNYNLCLKPLPSQTSESTFNHTKGLFYGVPCLCLCDIMSYIKIHPFMINFFLFDTSYRHFGAVRGFSKGVRRCGRNGLHLISDISWRRSVLLVHQETVIFAYPTVVSTSVPTADNVCEYEF
jgi:hypothetical protein